MLEGNPSPAAARNAWRCLATLAIAVFVCAVPAAVLASEKDVLAQPEPDQGALASDANKDNRVDAQDLHHYLKTWPSRKAFTRTQGDVSSIDGFPTGSSGATDDRDNQWTQVGEEDADVFPEDPNDLFLSLDAKNGSRNPTSEDPTIVRRQPVLVRFHLLEAASQGKQQTISFNLFAGVRLQGRIEGVIRRSDSRYSLLGTIGGDAASFFHPCGKRGRSCGEHPDSAR